MKIRNNIVFTVLIVLVVATLSCKKKPAPATPPSPTVLPPSFSFTAFGITTAGVQYTINNPTGGPFQVTGSNGSNNSNYQTVVITVSNGSEITTPGTFTLNTAASNSSDNAVYTSGTFSYNTNASHTGTITFSKVDMANRVISASFSFSAIEYSPSNNNSGTISGSFTNVGF
jgi:hypothetical protein